MPTRNISLTAEQDAFIEKAVKSGEYQNASEAVREFFRRIIKPAAKVGDRVGMIGLLGECYCTGTPDPAHLVERVIDQFLQNQSANITEGNSCSLR